MVLALCLLMQLSGIDDSDDKLRELSLARDAYAYMGESDDKRLKELANIGTNNLGNPYREWYYPFGSAEFRIWIIDWYDGTGSIFRESMRGDATVTDWRLDLRLDLDDSSPYPRGTLARMLWHLGFVLDEKPTQDQSELLSAMQGYAGYAYARGPFSDYYAWTVYSDGRLRPYYNMYEPSGRSIRSYTPITLEEADAMGVQSFEGLRPVVWVKVKYGRQTWTERPNSVISGRRG